MATANLLLIIYVNSKVICIPASHILCNNLTDTCITKYVYFESKVVPGTLVLVSFTAFRLSCYKASMSVITNLF